MHTDYFVCEQDVKMKYVIKKRLDKDVEKTPKFKLSHRKVAIDIINTDLYT